MLLADVAATRTITEPPVRRHRRRTGGAERSRCRSPRRWCSRASGADTRLGELDTALEAAHAAGHAGDHDEWQAALRTANAQCRAVLEGG